MILSDEYKKYTNLIIPPWDIRYGNLGRIFRSYTFNDVVKYDEEGNLKYYIPGELLYGDYITQKTQLLVNDTDINNWIPARYASRLLEWSCMITPQEYFDLVILHNNNRLDRPRCITCKSYVEFSGRISWGYCKSYFWNKVKHVYCSNSCAKSYQGNHPEEYPLVAAHQSKFGEYVSVPKVKIKNDYRRYLNLGDPDDKVLFYLATTKNFVKYGLTIDKSGRISREYFNHDEGYLTFHSLWWDTRKNQANFEAHLKEYFEGKEYLPKTELHNIILRIKELLGKRPLPFKFD